MNDLLPGEKLYSKEPRFKVGDEVTADRGPFGAATWKRKVAKVHKRYLELDDGTKWGLNGLPWGSKPSYRRRGTVRLVHWEEENEAESLRSALMRRLEKHRCRDFTYEQLRQLWLIVGPETEKG